MPTTAPFDQVDRARAEAVAVGIVAEFRDYADVGAGRAGRDAQGAGEPAEIARQVVGVAVESQSAGAGDVVADDVVVIGAEGEGSGGGDADSAGTDEAARTGED